MSEPEVPTGEQAGPGREAAAAAIRDAIEAVRAERPELALRLERLLAELEER